jgi:hypothetical protein
MSAGGPPYQIRLDLQKKRGLTGLGSMTNQVRQDASRHLDILPTRYKFRSKRLAGRWSAPAAASIDAFDTRDVRQKVSDVTAHAGCHPIAHYLFALPCDLCKTT